MLRKVNLEPSPELAYIIGVIYGDGSAFVTKRKQYVIKLETASEEFAKNFARCLTKVCGKAHIYTNFKKSRNKHYYVACTYSKMLCEFLRDKERHRDVIMEFPCEFVRGFYDSEGGFYTQGTAYKLQMFNTDLDILRVVATAIEKCAGITPKIILYREKPRLYTISITKKDETLKFIEKVKPTIKSKPRKHKSPIYIKICEYCGKEFITRHKSQRFCSKGCFAKWESNKNNPAWKGGKVAVRCQNCGKIFYVYPSEIKKGGGKFCSRECKYRSKLWRERIARAKKRNKT